MPTTEIYTLSLHDALPIFGNCRGNLREGVRVEDSDPFHKATKVRSTNLDGVSGGRLDETVLRRREDRKSTRLNSSHVAISYAVFCLKKKIITIENRT